MWVVTEPLPKTHAKPVSRLQALYELHSVEVLRFLRRMLGDASEAEDAAQETFVRLHRALDRLDPDRPTRPYVLKIARNVAIAALRRRRRQKKLNGLSPEFSPATADTAERRETSALIHDALAALSPQHRSVVVLRHAHGLKLKDVAAALSCTPRTARNRLRAAAVLFERELNRRGVLGESKEGSQ
jgi:RNA polymerase sigma-70 factor (ECF subfamily)